MSYLKKRHNTWYARMGIPEVARPILGRNEFVKSLQTTLRSLAESRGCSSLQIGRSRLPLRSLMTV